MSLIHCLTLKSDIKYLNVCGNLDFKLTRQDKAIFYLYNLRHTGVQEENICSDDFILGAPIIVVS